MKTNMHFWSYLSHFFLEWEIFQTKSQRKPKHTFVFSNVFFSKIVLFIEMMWKNIVDLGRTRMTIWCMRIACRTPKATNTHSVCVTLIAFPLQQWLHGPASMLLYKYFACLLNVRSLSCRIPGTRTFFSSFYQLRIHNHLSKFHRYMPRVEYSFNLG